MCFKGGSGYFFPSHLPLFLPGGWDVDITAGVPATILDHEVMARMETVHALRQSGFLLSPDRKAEIDIVCCNEQMHTSAEDPSMKQEQRPCWNEGGGGRASEEATNASFDAQARSEEFTGSRKSSLL